MNAALMMNRLPFIPGNSLIISFTLHCTTYSLSISSCLRSNIRLDSMQFMQKVLAFLIVTALLAFLPWIVISQSASGRIYTNVHQLPEKTYGLLLGTSPGTKRINPFFLTRIEAAKELYERKKITHIIVSGDNSTAAYNEPLYMKTALLRAGIPEHAITMDVAGFRTLDSVLRAKEVFSLENNLTIISQPFHLERALYLARVHGIDAIGYGAADVNLSYGIQTYIREVGARWLAVYDSLR